MLPGKKQGGQGRARHACTLWPSQLGSAGITWVQGVRHDALRGAAPGELSRQQQCAVLGVPIGAPRTVGARSRGRGRVEGDLVEGRVGHARGRLEVPWRRGGEVDDAGGGVGSKEREKALCQRCERGPGGGYPAEALVEIAAAWPLTIRPELVDPPLRLKAILRVAKWRRHDTCRHVRRDRNTRELAALYLITPALFTRMLKGVPAAMRASAHSRICAWSARSSLTKRTSAPGTADRISAAAASPSFSFLAPSKTRAPPSASTRTVSLPMPCATTRSRYACKGYSCR